VQPGGRVVEAAVGVLEVDDDVLVGHLRDAVDGIDEVHVPRRAAELAVGRRPQADVALHADDVGDGLVLYPPELRVLDLPGGVPGAGVEEVLRAEEAADVVGAERRA
jgi:hypothetical protein